MSAAAVTQFTEERPASEAVEGMLPDGVDLDVEVVPKSVKAVLATPVAQPLDDRFLPHPSHAAAAPTREDFAAAGPVIATGHPGLQGIQVGYRSRQQCAGAGELLQ